MSDTPATPEQIELIKNSGASSLADLAKQGGDFTLTAEEISNHGAGFVSDMLRMQQAAKPPDEFVPYVAAIENVANQNPANVKVSADDFPNFPPNTLVKFSETGEPLLDAPDRDSPFAVTSNNSVGKTFKVDADLSSLSASIVTGTVSTTTYEPQLELALLKGEPKWQQPLKSQKSPKAEAVPSPTTTVKSKQTAAPPRR